VKQADETDRRINALSLAANRLNDVIKLITSVERTNLLELNDPIETARAGEAGRGFAVMAQEVKALASQTLKATDKIGIQIAGMLQEALGSIKMISSTIGKISEITSVIPAAIQERSRPLRTYPAISGAPPPVTS
jgi:methyl-accepting chemotaxis protein